MTDKTSDLMEKLQSTENTAELDRYLEEIRGKYPKDLSSYIKAILAEKGMSTADMQKKSGIDRTYIYQIMDGSISLPPCPQPCQNTPDRQGWCLFTLCRPASSPAG